MKLNNGEIFNAWEPLQKLAGKELPVKASLGLARITNRLREQYNSIELVRRGLIRKYGKADKDNPQQIAVRQDSEEYPKFAAEVVELMNQEADEVVFERVKLPEEVDGKTLQIKPEILIPLEGKFVEVG